MQIKFTAIASQATDSTGQAIVSDHLAKIDIAIVDAPALTGSDKQVAYADAIRSAAIIDTCKATIDRVQLPSGQWLKNESWMTPEALDAIAKLNISVVRLADALAAHTTAKSWIEAHNGSKSQLTVRALLTRKAA